MFKFRVTKPFQNVKIVIQDGDRIIKSIKKMFLLPSEMENVSLNLSELKDCKSLSIEIMED